MKIDNAYNQSTITLRFLFKDIMEYIFKIRMNCSIKF